MNRTFYARIALAVDEAMREHSLSQRELASRAGVSRGTVAKMAAGRPVRHHLAVKVATAIIVTDLYAVPSPAPAPLEVVNGMRLVPPALEGA